MHHLLQDPVEPGTDSSERAVGRQASLLRSMGKKFTHQAGSDSTPRRLNDFAFASGSTGVVGPLAPCFSLAGLRSTRVCMLQVP